MSSNTHYLTNQWQLHMSFNTHYLTNQWQLMHTNVSEILRYYLTFS